MKTEQNEKSAALLGSEMMEDTGQIAALNTGETDGRYRESQISRAETHDWKPPGSQGCHRKNRTATDELQF